ncbi:MAG: bifunctional (p)ppGpp synthetase/guanosine-3',5'-bis(diphosphate) 3'-pyrophosphohydrolase [Alphaproteobacteria bacterium]|nr:bifunctional (p)ppGpp synthetase/guanosine-3',5'-bis(diphosphate) 3'-pyrophosphohydrolase [Alphaproteobacteria bacterium]
MMLQSELVEKVRAYDPSADAEALVRAYEFAMKAHREQTRASGDPYFSHPLEVAGILTNYRLDTASIITALLHDTIEDTEATSAEIAELFGDEVAQLVDGVTKLTQLELQSDRAKQAENFRKLLLAMSRDIRVLLVKLADRLHNMRTLHHVPKEERRHRIAHETMDIYAPLAERIGMHDIKDELEDRAFRELYPDARDSISRRLQFMRSEGDSVVEAVLVELRAVFAEAGIGADIAGREKSPYSIWRKMQRTQSSVEQLSDIIAFRVVVPTVSECYQALGVVHGRYQVVPGRFKDYLSTPKPNGYRSLHTSVIGLADHRIEIQIRTRDMHDVAERGVAAHWVYKETGSGPASSALREENRQYRWLQELLEILENAAAPEDFLAHTRLEMFSDQVFCFSPKGEVYSLPRGSTSIDFAYAVHTDIGDKCVGAKVNGRNMPLRTALQNGDQVEILISKNQTPSPDWEKLVVTGKAKARIRRVLREQETRQYVDLGRSIVGKAFDRLDEVLENAPLNKALREFHAGSTDDLFAMVGQGVYTGRDVARVVFPGKADGGKSAKSTNSIFSLRRKKPAPSGGGEHAVPISGLTPGIAVHMAKCCYPLPGDRIVGVMTTGKGVTIHTIDCMTLEAFADSPERWIDVSWDPDSDITGGELVSRLNVTLMNEPGSLADLATTIAGAQGNISNLKFTNRTADFFDMVVDIEVADAKHLNAIMTTLRGHKSVSTIERARS